MSAADGRGAATGASPARTAARGARSGRGALAPGGTNGTFGMTGPGGATDCGAGGTAGAAGGGAARCAPVSSGSAATGAVSGCGFEPCARDVIRLAVTKPITSSNAIPFAAHFHGFQAVLGTPCVDIPAPHEEPRLQPRYHPPSADTVRHARSPCGLFVDLTGTALGRFCTLWKTAA